MNQINENMNWEKYEFQDDMIEQQEDFRIKEIEDKNNIIEQINKGDINMAANEIIELQERLVNTRGAKKLEHKSLVFQST